ncbi:MAG TPA: T9SS type A sorting domain-containing protein [Candidatus Kapabacteria bacterium]
MKAARDFLLSFLLVSILATTSIAQSLNWQVVTTSSQRVSIVYFIDANVGFYAIGTVPGDPSVTAKLFRTNDGGNSWNQASVESLGGNGISDIQFEDALNGFACGGSTDSYGRFWVTTDGGVTWKKRSGNGLSYPMTTRKTEAGILVTDFSNQLMISVDNGNNFNFIETTPVPETHLGMDFVDSLHGVVDGNYRHSSTSWYYTEDGGLTWQSSGTQMETWSIYGERGTPRFYACPEGYSNQSGYKSQVFRSTNYGKSFQEVFRFPFQMTGHVAGAGGALYAQTAFSVTPGKEGMYRSTDQGENWELLGGPTGRTDTRFFVVPDCEGNIIYASGLDRKIYKAVDRVGSSGGGSSKEVPCLADYKNSSAVTPGSRVTVPIGIKLSSTSDVIGEQPKQIEYVVLFDPEAIDTGKFSSASDVVPPVGWALKSALMRGDSLVVTLLNVANDGIVELQGFGFVVFTVRNGTSLANCPIAIASVTLSAECVPFLIVPSIEQSTLTVITIVTSGLAHTEGEDKLLTLYPNPATSNITLRSDLLSTGKSSVTIFDARGVAVMDMILPSQASGEYQLSLGSLAAGSYTLRLSHSESAPIIKGFVIE